MDSPALQRTVLFHTRWFELVAKSRAATDADPHYAVATRDYVSVFAITPNKTFLLVRQFRPAIEEITLELPSGYVEKGETPEEAARRELLEETGFTTRRLIPLGVLTPDTGRLENRMWSYLALDVVLSTARTTQEPNLELVMYSKPLSDLLTRESSFCCALNHATILAAVAGGHIQW